MKRLKKKYFRILFFTTASLLILFSLALCIFYSDALKKDYNEKASTFSRQQLAGIERRFIQFNRMADDFFACFPSLDLSVSKASVLHEMNRLNGKNLSIASVFFVEPDLSYIAVPSSILLNFPDSIIGQHPELFTGAVPGYRWYMLSNIAKNDETGFLLCLYSTEGRNGSGLFTLCFLTKAADMLPLPEEAADDSHLFSGRNYTTALSCDSENILSVDLTRYPVLTVPQNPENETADETGAAESAAEPKSSARNTPAVPDYTYQLEGTPFRLSVTLVSSPFRRMLLFFLLGLACLLVVLVLIAAAVLNAYLNRVTNALDSLSEQFSQFNSAENSGTENRKGVIPHV